MAALWEIGSGALGYTAVRASRVLPSRSCTAAPPRTAHECDLAKPARRRHQEEAGVRESEKVEINAEKQPNTKMK